MATTELAPVMEDASRWQFEASENRASLRVSWVVVTGSAGRRQLQMQWTPSADLG